MNEGIFIAQIVGSGASNDGENAIIQGSDEKNSDVYLVLPREKLFDLIDVAAKQYSEDGATRTRISAERLAAYHVSGYEIGTSAGRNGAILALQFGQGGKLVYFLPDDMLEHMIEGLQAVTGKISPKSHGKLSH